MPWRDDPDRYAVVVLDAMLALRIGSERACTTFVASWQVGVEGDPPIPGRWQWLRFLTKPGAHAGTLEGRAASLREKQRRCRSAEEATWRRWMASAIMATVGTRDPESAKTVVLERAERVGEGDFARRVLWRLIDARFSGQFSIQHEADAVR